MIVTKSFNGISAIIVTIVVIISFKGIQDSALFNNIILVINVAALFCGIVIGFAFFKLSHLKGIFDISLKNFIETIQLCFFVFLGYDNATCFTEESKNPKKDIPFVMRIGLLLSISINSLLAFALIGMAGPINLKQNDAFLIAFDVSGHKIIGYFITLGPLLGLLSALICGINSVSRVMYYMASDRLLLKSFLRLEGKKKVSLNSLLFSGLLVLVFSTTLALESLEETVSLACLVEYSSVSLSFLVAKYKQSTKLGFIKVLGGSFMLISYAVGFSIYLELSIIVTFVLLSFLVAIGVLIGFQRPGLKKRASPLLPLVGVALNLGFGGTLGVTPAMIIFMIYMALVVAFYFKYSMKHSKLAMKEQAQVSAE